jgi:excisionase family DNA binding protein
MNTQSNDNGMPLRMLTVREVAAVLNIHPNTVRRWGKKGLLKSYGIGPRHSLRFRQEDVLDFLDESQNEVHKVGN